MKIATKNLLEKPQNVKKRKKNKITTLVTQSLSTNLKAIPKQYNNMDIKKQACTKSTTLTTPHHPLYLLLQLLECFGYGMKWLFHICFPHLGFFLFFLSFLSKIISLFASFFSHLKEKTLKKMYNLCLQIFFKTSICTPQPLHPFDKIIHNKWDMICSKIPCK